MKTEQMESIPAGNPFDHDAYNMGERITSNVMVMMDVFEDQKASYIIIVNTETGERIRVTF